MNSDTKQIVSFLVFAVVVLALVLIVIFSGKTKHDDAVVDNEKEHKAVVVETLAKTSPKPSETSQEEHRKAAEMRENEETVGETMPESSPAPQKEMATITNGARCAETA